LPLECITLCLTDFFSYYICYFFVTTYIIKQWRVKNTKHMLYISPTKKVLLHFMMQFIFFLLFSLFYLQSNKMSISFCSHNHFCKHLCNYFQCITLLKVNKHYTTNKLKHREIHMSLFYEHILTNTFDIKRKHNKLENYIKV
jgi:hypothetical protein